MQEWHSRFPKDLPIQATMGGAIPARAWRRPTKVQTLLGLNRLPPTRVTQDQAILGQAMRQPD